MDLQRCTSCDLSSKVSVATVTSHRQTLNGHDNTRLPWREKNIPSCRESLLGKRINRIDSKAIESALPQCKPDCVLRQLGASAKANEVKDERFGCKPETPSQISEEGRLASRNLYKALRPWQTRIIQLIPADESLGPDAFPSCRLLTVEFIDMPGVGVSETDEVITYSALSYVWGQTALDSQILCNGIWLPICRSLAVALFHLSKSGRQRYLWCDAICIDQSNLAERALQVNNMLRIFEKAESVVAWLGEIPRAEFPYLAFIKREMNENVSAFVRLGDQKVQHSEDCGPALRTLRVVLQTLTQQAFFMRTWIRQEIFSATVLTLQFTDFKMKFDFRSQNTLGVATYRPRTRHRRSRFKHERHTAESS